MIKKTLIKFLRSGLNTSLQGAPINNLQHLGITTSGPMDNFLSKIGNISLDNQEETLCFEICRLGPKIQILEGIFIFLISGNVNFDIISEYKLIKGRCNQSYTIKKGDKIDIKTTINSNYGYLIFKGQLEDKIINNLSSSILSSSLGVNQGKKILDSDEFRLSTITNFKKRKLDINIQKYYKNIIRVLPGPQMHYFKIKNINKFFNKKFKISKNSNRVGIRLLENTIKSTLNNNISSEGIIKGSIQIPGDGNPIILASEHPTIGGYPKIASIIMTDFAKIVQLEEGTDVFFEAVNIETAEKEYFKLKKLLKNLKKNIVYLQ